MLKKSIVPFDPQIKCHLSDSSQDVLAGLSFIRHGNEQLVKELDHTLAQFEASLAGHRAFAYAD